MLNLAASTLASIGGRLHLWCSWNTKENLYKRLIRLISFTTKSKCSRRSFGYETVHLWAISPRVQSRRRWSGMCAFSRSLAPFHIE